MGRAVHHSGRRGEVTGRIEGCTAATLRPGAEGCGVARDGGRRRPGQLSDPSTRDT